MFIELGWAATPLRIMTEKKEPSPLGPAILEYLRNLTPQILLLALALVAFSRLDTARLDISVSGVKNIFPPLLLLGLFFAALASNTAQFLQRILEGSDNVAIETIRLARRQLPLYKSLLALFPLIWRTDRWYAVRIAAAFFVIFTGTVVLFAAAVPQAVGFLKVLAS